MLELLLSAELLPLRGTRWEIYAWNAGNNPQNEEDGIKFLVSVSRPNIKFIPSHKEPRPGPASYPQHPPADESPNALSVVSLAREKPEKAPKARKTIDFPRDRLPALRVATFPSDFVLYSSPKQSKKKKLLPVLTRQNKPCGPRENMN